MKILQFLQDERGCFSSTRLVFLIWSIGMFVVWTILSIRCGQPAEISDNAMWILLSLMSGKAIQKFGESKMEKTPVLPEKTNGTDKTNTVSQAN